MAYQYPILIALMAQRLWEVLVSRKRLAEDERAEVAEAIAEPAYAAMVLVHGLWLAGCWFEVLYLRPPFVSWIVIPAMALWVVALLLRVWLMIALGRLWNVRLISRKDQEVVTRGPYRFIRHPNYVAVIIEMAVVPLMLGAYWSAVLGSIANGFILWIRIRKEEAYLESSEEYREAFANKKRLIPGIF